MQECFVCWMVEITSIVLAEWQKIVVWVLPLFCHSSKVLRQLLNCKHIKNSLNCMHYKYICKWTSRKQLSHAILSTYVQSRSLLLLKETVLVCLKRKREKIGALKWGGTPIQKRKACDSKYVRMSVMPLY